MSINENLQQDNDFSEDIEKNDIFVGDESSVEDEMRLKKYDKLVKTEKKKMLKLLSKIDDNLLKICDSLMENIAFMSVLTSDLMEVIKAKGVKEVYYNGKNQYGIRERIEMKTYNVTIKNLYALMKCFIDLLSKNGLNDEDAEKLKEMFARPR